MKHLRIRIYGRVQRIGYRFHSMQVAYKYDVKGLVRNMTDGSIYIEAEGEDRNMDMFVEWCKKGPMGARIDNIVTEEGEMKNYSSFDIDHA